jgi:hypothetical protein
LCGPRGAPADGDIQLGKLTLYQLSYARLVEGRPV